MEIHINISVSMDGSKADVILREAMERINQVAKDGAQWKKHQANDCCETSCDIQEEDIMPIFNELIAEYPQLDICASYSYDIREDDSSAQWWGTTKIKTEHHPDGTAALSADSSTQWF